MSRFFETIRLDKGKPGDMRFHEARYRKTLWDHFALQPQESLEEMIQCPPETGTDVVRCRIDYGPGIESVTYAPYVPRIITKLRLVSADGLDYAYKYADRNRLEMMRGNDPGSDILMVKNGMITDTSFANVALLKKGKWYTPLVPLLEGTRRAALLEAGVVLTAVITPASLLEYEELRLINAMLTLEDSVPVPVTAISSTND